MPQTTIHHSCSHTPPLLLPVRLNTYTHVYNLLESDFAVFWDDGGVYLKWNWP